MEAVAVGEKGGDTRGRGAGPRVTHGPLMDTEVKIETSQARSRARGRARSRRDGDISGSVSGQKRGLSGSRNRNLAPVSLS